MPAAPHSLPCSVVVNWGNKMTSQEIDISIAHEYTRSAITCLQMHTAAQPSNQEQIYSKQNRVNSGAQ